MNIICHFLIAWYTWLSSCFFLSLRFEFKTFLLKKLPEMWKKGTLSEYKLKVWSKDTEEHQNEETYKPTLELNTRFCNSCKKEMIIFSNSLLLVPYLVWNLHFKDHLLGKNVTEVVFLQAKHNIYEMKIFMRKSPCIRPKHELLVIAPMQLFQCHLSITMWTYWKFSHLVYTSFLCNHKSHIQSL